MDAQPGTAAAAGAPQSRAALRLQSVCCALASGSAALVVALVVSRLGPGAVAPNLSAALEAGLRGGGCGFFYGLLAFHLQRADPDDSHLQAGLVGAMCGICSLASPIPMTEGWSALRAGVLAGWLPLWLPLVGGALALRLVPNLMRP